MRERSWDWLRTRILGLLTRQATVLAFSGELVRVPANRLQAVFSGSDVERHRAHN